MDAPRLTDLSYLRALMARHGVATKKKYGQNFLINPAIPVRIAEVGCPLPEAGILEIGPGVGTLTRELCARARRVVALEIDQTLLPVLNETLSDYNNVEVILADVLKTDLSVLFAEKFPGCSSVCVCANLPYYITTPVLMYLLESGVPFRTVTVMVQKEVAERLTAPAGSPEYGAITAAVSYYGRAERLFTVSPGSFLPAPKVESCVVRITLHENSPYADCDRALLFSLVKAGFEQRRKTLLNTLRGLLSESDRTAVAKELVTLGHPADVRAEKLSIDDFAALARALKN